MVKKGIVNSLTRLEHVTIDLFLVAALLVLGIINPCLSDRYFQVVEVAVE